METQGKCLHILIEKEKKKVLVVQWIPSHTEEADRLAKTSSGWPQHQHPVSFFFSPTILSNKTCTSSLFWIILNHSYHLCMSFDNCHVQEVNRYKKRKAALIYGHDNPKHSATAVLLQQILRYKYLMNGAMPLTQFHEFDQWFRELVIHHLVTSYNSFAAVLFCLKKNK